MKRTDIICRECSAGLRRIELNSVDGIAGECRCPLCDHVLEVSDGSSKIVYRLTVAPEKLYEQRHDRTRRAALAQSGYRFSLATNAKRLRGNHAQSKKLERDGAL